MTTAYTNLLGFALPVTGELSGTWGTVVNDSITELVEDAIAGVATASVTATDWTLTDTGSGVQNQARCAILIPTGTPGTTRNILAPNSSKAYVVVNQSNGAVVVKGVTGPTTGVAVAAGMKALVAWNGSDFVQVGFSEGGAATFSQVDITAQGELRLQDAAGGQYAALKAPATIASSYTLTLPVDDGLANEVLTTNGSGVLSWATPVNLNSPLNVIGNNTAGASIVLPEDTDNGSNTATVKAPDALTSDVTLTLPQTTSVLGYLNLPPVGTKTSGYQLTTADVGKYVQVGTSGSITIPDATFSEGDAISIFNNTSGNITITCNITTAYIAGTDADKASVTLATRGVCTVLFISGTICVITGNVT